MVNKARVAPLLSEFLGTALLVMVALIMTGTTAVSYFIATSLALALAVIVMFFGPVSGAHTNPAITFGMWTARKIGTLRAASYIVVQLLGGLAAWQLFQYLTDKPLAAKASTYTTPMWVAELVGTAILGMGFAAALARGLDSLQSALTIGASIFSAVLVASVASAGYINPAIALGLRSFSWVYVLGPLVGGLIGINLYMMFFAPDKARAANVKVSSRSSKKK